MLHASRTLVWLKGQEVLVTYDRATTAHSGKFKRFNMNFIAPPTVSGNVVTAVGKVNKVQVTSLLPVNGNISIQVGCIFCGCRVQCLRQVRCICQHALSEADTTADRQLLFPPKPLTPILPAVPWTHLSVVCLQMIPPWKNPAEYEPSTHYMAVEDAGRPADVRFLHVLQITDAAAAAPTPALLLTGSVNGGATGTAHGKPGGTPIRFSAEEVPRPCQLEAEPCAVPSRISQEAVRF